MTNYHIKKLVPTKLISGLTILMVALSGFAGLPVGAKEALRIVSVDVDITNTTATISWTTNRPASGTLEYGLNPNQMGTFVETNRKLIGQVMTLSKLEPNTTYYFQITALDETSQAQTFVQNFKTTKRKLDQPIITSRVRAVYVTGTTATIQWLTNLPTTTEVEYGPTTTYGRKATGDSKAVAHDITIRGLKRNTVYHFRVKSKDADNNIVMSGDLTFKTERLLTEEQSDLQITNVTPVSQNDQRVTQTSAVVTWRTNKLASGWIRYQKLSGGKTTTLTEPLPRKFVHSLTMTDLQPNTTYRVEIISKDVFGKSVTSRAYTITTREGRVVASTGGNSGSGSNGGQVLGAFTCNLDLDTDLGFYGMYYNLPSGHPDMELFRGKPIPAAHIAAENDWYDPKYFSWSRVDAHIDFPGKFLPLDEGLAGDPYDFAVFWRAAIEVPETATYQYSVASDDDSWVFIDGELVTDLGGVHSIQKKSNRLELSKGYHTLEIYYAERSKSGAAFSFKPDSRLKFHPLPEGCEIDDVGSTGHGQVLGASTADYTQAIALYKTANSPDIYAIYRNGFRHYISGPTSFGNYGYNIKNVKTVSQETLNKYPEARLVKMAGSDTVYYLYQRPQHQWIKIPIPSSTVFISYAGNRWSDIITVNERDMSSYPDAQLVKLIGGDQIYLIDGQTKRPFVNIAAINALGYNPDEAVAINQTHLNSYIDGDVIR